MTKEDASIRIELTKEQRKQIKDASGDDVTAIEFSAQELEVAAIEPPVKELEQRIAPSLVGNHNETLLAEPFPFCLDLGWTAITVVANPREEP